MALGQSRRFRRLPYQPLPSGDVSHRARPAMTVAAEADGERSAMIGALPGSWPNRKGQRLGSFNCNPAGHGRNLYQHPSAAARAALPGLAHDPGQDWQGQRQRAAIGKASASRGLDRDSAPLD